VGEKKGANIPISKNRRKDQLGRLSGRLKKKKVPKRARLGKKPNDKCEVIEQAKGLKNREPEFIPTGSEKWTVREKKGGGELPPKSVLGKVSRDIS